MPEKRKKGMVSFLLLSLTFSSLLPSTSIYAEEMEDLGKEEVTDSSFTYDSTQQLEDSSELDSSTQDMSEPAEETPVEKEQSVSEENTEPKEEVVEESEESIPQEKGTKSLSEDTGLEEKIEKETPEIKKDMEEDVEEPVDSSAEIESESKEDETNEQEIQSELSQQSDIPGYVYSPEETREMAIRMMEEDQQQKNRRSARISLFSLSAPSHVDQFIQKFAPLAVKHANANDLYPSVMLAQAALESGWGRSSLARAPYHQLFGIKNSGGFSGDYITVETKEWVKDPNHKDGGYFITILDQFRVYDSFEGSFKDQTDFLGKPRYKNVHVEYAPTYEHATQALQSAGYATDPDYASKLNSIIATYELWRFDGLPSVNYSTHVQSHGWMPSVNDGGTSGTIGQKKRVEAFTVDVSRFEGLGVRYKSYVDGKGWQAWKYDGDASGTMGQSKRIEALQMQLTGEQAKNFDIYYRVHVESFGWLDWAKNGQVAGAEDILNKRIEAMDVRIVKKGRPAPGRTNSPYRVDTSQVAYSTHVQSYGWLNTVSAGETSGTMGQRKRLEAIQLELINSRLDGNIEYRTHVQTHGWLDWVSNGKISGTTNQAKRMEAIQIQLTGEIAKHYDVYYRVHSEYHSWMGWAKNGEKAGTEGKGRRMEAIEVQLVRKGEPAPGRTSQPFVK